MRHKPKNKSFKVLELGCGAGANIPFFTSLEADYYAVEGSRSIVGKLHNKFPQLKNNIFVGDFSDFIPDIRFDLIVDRASLTCNHEESIIRCLKKCYESLNIGGKYIGVDWFSTHHSDYLKGTQAEDIWTKKDMVGSGFEGTGRVHFSDQNHLMELFKEFEVKTLSHSVLSEKIPDLKANVSTWNFVMEKI
jgi:SAM-dependent methyltransferase